jgi:tetratricopeptide (TPR) repeat protein
MKMASIGIVCLMGFLVSSIAEGHQQVLGSKDSQGGGTTSFASGSKGISPRKQVSGMRDSQGGGTTNVASGTATSASESSAGLFESWLKKARRAIDSGNYSAAERAARSAAEFTPPSGSFASPAWRAQHELAEALMREGKNEQALRLFEEISGAPGSVPRIGLLMLRCGHMRESKDFWDEHCLCHTYGETLDEAKKLPADSNRKMLEGSWLFLIVREEQAGNLPAYVYYLHKAAELIPGNPLLEQRLGGLYVDQQDYKRAVKAFTIAFEHSRGPIKDQIGEQRRHADWYLHLPEWKSAHPELYQAGNKR